MFGAASPPSPGRAQGGQPRPLGSQLVEGPFEFSPDGQKVLFASPRIGSFLSMVTLDASGKDALKRLSSDTELAPALAAGHPTQVPLPQAAGAPGTAAAVPATPTANPAPGPPRTASARTCLRWSA